MQTDAAQSNLSSAGNLIVVTTAGSLQTLAAGGAVSAAGNLLMQAGGLTSDLTLGAAVSNTAGATSLKAGRALVQNANITASGNGTVDARAATSIGMADGVLTSSASGNIRYAAGSTLTLGALSTTGNVSLSASSITDSGTSGTTDVTANELRLVTMGTASGNGAGTASNHLKLNVSKLAASVLGAGGLYVTEANDLVIGTLSAINVNGVNADGTVTATTDAAQSNLTSAGHLIVVTTAGSIETQLAGGALSAAGNLLMQAGGLTSDLTLGAAVSNTAGATSLKAGRALVQNANITASGNGTVDARAATSIGMADGVLTSSASGNIRYAAGSTLTLGALSTTGNVSLSASSITDSGTSGTTDVTANELRLVTMGTASGNGAGTASNHLKLNVSKLAASVLGAGGLYVTEANDLVIGTLSAINVNGVNADGTVTATTDAAQSNLTSAGHLIVVTTAGSLQTLAAGGAVSAAGDLLVQAGAITLGAAVSNTAGSSRVNAAGSIVQNANITASGAGQSIDLMATGAITMGQGATTASANGAVSLNAVTGDITVETLDAGTAKVQVTAQAGSILDRADSGAVDITAGALMLSAGNSIGNVGNALEISVDTLSASAGAGGLYVLESDGLAIGSVAVTGEGAVQVNVASGNLTLGVGGIQTTGAGTVVLGTQSASGAVTLNGTVSTDLGTITVQAAGAFGQNAQLVSNHGAVVVTAGTDAVFAAGSGIQTDANVSVRAAHNLVMPDARVDAGSGLISLSAGNLLEPGVVHTNGRVTLVTDASGTVVFSRTGDRLADDIQVTSNHLDIQAELSSPGAVLRIATLTPAAGSLQYDIVIGGHDLGSAGTALYLSLQEIDRLQEGFSQIVLGNGQAGQTVVLQGLTDAATAASSPVVFKDPVLVDLSGAGSKLGLTGQVQGQSLLVVGTGATTVLLAADLRMSGNITVGGTLKVANASAITSTAGNLVLGEITGLKGAADPAEVLSLSANGGNLVVNGSVHARPGRLAGEAGGGRHLQ